MIKKQTSFPLEPALIEFRANINKLYGNEIERIILFGSRARGDAKQDADIDVLVIMKHAGKELKNRISDLAFDCILKYGIDIEPVIFDHNEWARFTTTPTSFAYCVLQDGKEL